MKWPSLLASPSASDILALLLRTRRAHWQWREGYEEEIDQRCQVRNVNDAVKAGINIPFSATAEGCERDKEVVD